MSYIYMYENHVENGKLNVYMFDLGLHEEIQMEGLQKSTKCQSS
jgi:hypothetical protein